MKPPLAFFRPLLKATPTSCSLPAALRGKVYGAMSAARNILPDQFPQARQSLERAMAGDREENIARLYLGLTLIQQGERQPGLKEIETGLRGIQSFIDNIARTQGFNIGQFWDPNRDIRNAIQYNLKLISSENINWQQLTANIERIALQMERETDLARRQESREMRSRDRGRP